MMKKSSNKNNSLMPDIFVCIGYKSIYDDYETVDINKVIEGIPSIAILNFLTVQYNRVLYAFSDAKMQKQQIRDYCKYVSKSTKERIWNFSKKYDNCVIYETYGYSLALGYVFQNFTPLAADDKDFDLCEDEYENVFKLILYCNQKWTDSQTDGKYNNLIEISLKLDLPIVEFKHFKDFKFQLFKAIPLFVFLESDPYYKNILPNFYKDKNVTCWQEYLMKIFDFFCSSLNSQFINVGTSNLELIAFVNQYCIKIDECVNLQEGHNSLNYLRDHFIFKFGDCSYLLLNNNLLVDKIYQGLRFDLYKTITTHNIANKNGNKFSGFPEFNSLLGTDFSEPMLLYSLMQKTFKGRYSIMYTGAELKSKGIVAEPDLYMRIGNVLYLFEFKDISLGDTLKYSSDITSIRSAICDRICLFNEKKKKGAGQLHNTIDSIINKHSMNKLDPQIKDITDIVPVIVTTDRSFSAIGVQALVVEEYQKFPSIFFKGFLSIPIVIDFDTLLDLSYRLNKGFLDFTQLIKDYLFNKDSILQPFSSFVFDKHKREKNLVSKDEINYLLAEPIEHMANSKL